MSRMTTIATEALESVTGGTSKPPVSTGSTGGGDNDKVLAALTGIQNTLGDIGKNNSGNNNNALFMGMGLALAMRQRQQQTVVVGGGRGGYYWQSSWA